jgi:hypothetical protein
LVRTSYPRRVDDVLHELDKLQEGEGGRQGVVLVAQLQFDRTLNCKRIVKDSFRIVKELKTVKMIMETFCVVNKIKEQFQEFRIFFCKFIILDPYC